MDSYQFIDTYNSPIHKNTITHWKKGKYLPLREEIKCPLYCSFWAKDPSRAKIHKYIFRDAKIPSL